MPSGAEALGRTSQHGRRRADGKHAAGCFDSDYRLGGPETTVSGISERATGDVREKGGAALSRRHATAQDTTQTLVTRASRREDELDGSTRPKGGVMPDSVYKVIEVIGTSATSWEEAAKLAVDKVASHLEDVRVAKVVELDLRLEENKIVAYRARLKVSFRYHDDH